MQILPASFLVRCRLPVPRIEKLPRSGARLLELPPECRLFLPKSMEAQQPFAEVRAAWNPRGLAFQVTVSGRTTPVLSNPDNPLRPDSVQLWIDTRDTQTVHRATRYCHSFVILPVGGGERGLEPSVTQLPVARAREDAPTVDIDDVLVIGGAGKQGYQVEAWFPAATLHGFDPDSQPRLGFSCLVRDAEFGETGLSDAEAFPVASDPSLWHSLELLP